jgi:hypothetical protein
MPSPLYPIALWSICMGADGRLDVAVDERAQHHGAAQTLLNLKSPNS